MPTLDSAALEALPVFPLPDVVLFPGALMPLHVFEPRYRELTADVLAGTRLMGIARLRPGYEPIYQERPPIFDVAGVGYVTEAEKLGDGRYHIALRGLARVAIERELPPDKAYRVVRSRVLVDTRSAHPERMQSAHEQIIALCDRLSMAMDEQGEKLRELVRALPSAGACADVIAAALVADPDERQALLEMLDPAERLDRVAGHVAALLVRLTKTSGSPN